MNHRLTLPGRVIALACFVLGSLVVYATALDLFFVSDDFNLIRSVEDRGAFGLWSSQDSDFFRPIISLSLYADHAIWQHDPVGYHLTNVIVHGLNAFLVWRMAARLLRDLALSPRRQRGAALLAGGLFLLLPSHTEAVAWIAGRTDVIATFFGLLALNAYLAYVDRGGRWRASAVLVWWGGALLAKEAVVTLPIIMLTYEFLNPAPSRHGWRRRIGLYVGGGILLLGYLACRYAITGHVVGGYQADHTILGVRDVARNFTILAARSVIPPLWIELESTTGYWLMLVTGLIAIGLIALGANPLRRWLRALAQTNEAAVPRLIFVTGAWVIALGPVAFFLNALASTLLTIEGERLVYFPSMFSTLLLVMGLVLAVRDRRVLVVLSLGIVVFYGVALAYSNRQWRQAATLTHDIVRSFEAVAPGGDVIVLVVPDSINGAYVFRNGLSNALTFEYGDRFGAVCPLTYVRLRSARDEIVVDAAAPGDYRLRTRNPSAAFVQRSVCGGANLTEFVCGGTYTPCAPEADGESAPFTGFQTRVAGPVVYYSAGGMVQIGG